MEVADDRVVYISYTLEDEEGQELESVGENDALAYLHGHDNIIPGLESELEGLDAGDDYSTTVPPEEGYGEHVEELVSEVDRSEFPANEELEPGMVFRARPADADQGEDATEFLMIRKIVDDTVVVDANHPLAGETLNYHGSIVEVREPSDAELDAGHPLDEE